MHCFSRTTDPYLARFAQADTIVPGGVQGYDRYAYVNNSPVRYTDPTGHNPIIDNDENGNPIVDSFSRPDKNFDKEQEDEDGGDQRCHTYNPCPVDKSTMLWRIIPTAYAFNVGFTYQTGLIVEPAIAAQVQFVYNIKSNEFDVLIVNMGSGSNDYGAGLFHIGAPTLIGIMGSAGITTYKGASTNDVLVGEGIFLGSDFQIDGVGKAGVSKEWGYATEPGSLKPYFDDETNMPITYSQSNLSFGANAFPNVVDGGVYGGHSVSTFWTGQLWK